MYQVSSPLAEGSEVLKILLVNPYITEEEDKFAEYVDV